MLLTYRYKMDLRKSQHALLGRLCEQQRLLYNAALQERIDAWRKAHISISKIDQNKSLTEIRTFDDAYGSVPVAMSRWSIARVDDAFKGFFSRVKLGEKPGFPRFKSKGRWRSFGFVEWDGIRLRNNRLFFKGAKSGLNLHLHRDLPADASPKSCAFTRYGRHWYVCLAIEVSANAQHTSPETAIGIDVGIEHLLTTSDGEHIKNPRVGKRSLAKLRRIQRALARCRRGSRRRVKVRERLTRAERTIAETRATFLHQTSALLTSKYAFIAVEKLNLRNMTRSARRSAKSPRKNTRSKTRLNRSLQDAAMGRLIELLSYKAERAGGTLVKVDARNTSQDCSSCGARVPKNLSQRIHKCECGVELQRDHNAALNILERALSAHGRARPPGDPNVGHGSMRGLGNAIAKAA